MFDDAYRPEQSAKLKQAFENPGIYTFMDISQVNSRNFDETHWEKLVYIMALADSNATRPINCVKIYGDGDFGFGSGLPVDGVERFWRDVFAGCAAVRHHRDGAGIGLRDSAKACIRAMRKLTGIVKPWECETRQDLLSSRGTDEAYLIADVGRYYGLYFTDGGSVGLNLQAYQGEFSVRWISIGTGDWGSETTITGGSTVTMAAPGAGSWAAAITGPTVGSVRKSKTTDRDCNISIYPMNGYLNISYTFYKSLPVSLAIYNMRGRRVSGLPVKVYPGRHILHWQYKNSFGNEMANGFYTVLYSADAKRISRKFLILK
jgi:hypothetical protein